MKINGKALSKAQRQLFALTKAMVEQSIELDAAQSNMRLSAKDVDLLSYNIAARLIK